MQNTFIRFVLVGGIAALVNVISRVMLSNLFSYQLAIVLAYLIGMAVAFLLNRHYVFNATLDAAGRQAIKFSLVNGLALIQVWLVTLAMFHHILPVLGWTWHADTVAHIVGVASPIVTSFVGHKYFSFRAGTR